MRKTSFVFTILIVIACHSCNGIHNEPKNSTLQTEFIQNTDVLEGTKQTIIPIEMTKEPRLNWIDQTKLYPFMVVGNDWGDVTMWDPDQGQYYTFPEYYDFLDWGDDGCSIWVQDVNGDLVQLDLNGQVIRHISLPVLDKELPINSLHFQLKLSPDQKSIAFWTGDGEVLNQMGLFFIYEIQDVYIISLEQYGNPVKISANGGGWKFAWSPDGERIAYSDFDEDGRLQIFIAQKDGDNRRQISYFEQNVSAIDDIEWSPDGQNIAFSVHNGEDWQVFYTLGEQLVRIKELNLASVLWWVTPETILIANKDGEKDNRTYYLLDILSISISPLPIIDQFKIHEGIHKFRSSEEMAFFVPNGNYVDIIIYNMRTSTLVRLPDVNLSFTDIILWSVTPLSFPGKEACLLNN